ncbi:MAG: arylsulfatase [Planctomycetes bacterium]|nr:arylsulfatase [Planctomycetota bacterium]
MQRLPSLFAALFALGACSTSSDGAERPRGAAPRPPNVIVILADDLGVGELGCYGQTKIKTPHLDTLAREGLRFTQYYAGAPLCAPSRCALLTGKHAGHAYIRDNEELMPEGQQPLRASEVTLAELLKSRGYATACVGKWGLGGPKSEGEPNAQGFDHFFGFLCQRRAHDHYPTYLWRDGARVVLSGNPGDAPGAQYAEDLFADDALAWITAQRERPFFLYFTPTIPHASLQAPAEDVAAYRGALADAPYDGKQGYIKVEEPHATYAAMVTRLDRDVGRLVAKIDELGLARDTLVLFASDNGPTYDRVGGADSDFFASTGGLRGRKGSVYEGGIRAPLIARWSGKIAPGRTTDEVAAAWDLMPTIVGLADARPRTSEATAPIALPLPLDLDGVDLSPLLLGELFGVKRHLYWELRSYGGQQAARFGDWKAVRREIDKGNTEIELYDLAHDPNETHDLANERPELVEHAKKLLESSRTDSELFPLGR